MEITKQAIEKINTGLKEYKADRYGAVMKESVANALKMFTEQEEEFAQAILDGGSFTECMRAVIKFVGNRSGLSDIDAYKAAVQFYFPGAEIEMQMVLHMSRFDMEDAPQDTVVLRLEDFL